MKMHKLFTLSVLFALLALTTDASFAQEVSDLPKVTISTAEAIPVAIPVAEPTAVETVAVAVSPDQTPSGVEAFVLDVFLALVQKFPWLATLIVFMGMCRVFAKPVFSMIHTLVDLTPSKSDDGLLNSALLFFTTHPAGKAIAFGIDWLTSIKIKPPVK